MIIHMKDNPQVNSQLYISVTGYYVQYVASITVEPQHVTDAAVSAK